METHRDLYVGCGCTGFTPSATASVQDHYCKPALQRGTHHASITGTGVAGSVTLKAAFGQAGNDAVYPKYLRMLKVGGATLP